MILIIKTNKELLHDYEFVKPIEDIIKKVNFEYEIKHLKDTNKINFSKYSKIIICGTSLQDNNFLNYDFSFLKNISIPILGICAGAQLIGLSFGGKLKKQTEIGFYKENFEKDFLGLSGICEVYHLHNFYIEFSKLKEFEVFNTGKIPQAVKHKAKPIYGVLFHPEVRNKEMIKSFLLN